MQVGTLLWAGSVSRVNINIDSSPDSLGRYGNEMMNLNSGLIGVVNCC